MLLFILQSIKTFNIYLLWSAATNSNSCFKDTRQSLNRHAKDRLAQYNRHATQIKGKISSLDHAHKTMHSKRYVNLTRLLLFLDTRQSKTLWATVCSLHPYELKICFGTLLSANCCQIIIFSSTYFLWLSRVCNNCIVVHLSSVPQYHLCQIL